MAFSPSFNTMIDTMAADPEGSAKTFTTGWITPFTDVHKANAGIIQKLVDAGLQKLSGAGQYIWLLSYIFETGFTWRNFVGTLLESTGKIDPKMKLNAAPLPWAVGKQWLIGHSIMTAPSSHTNLFVSNSAGLYKFQVRKEFRDTVASSCVSSLSGACVGR